MAIMKYCSFWEDLWIGQEPLKARFPTFYRIVRRKGDLVARVLCSTPLNISFSRTLVGERMADWLNLVSLVVLVSLNDNKDVLLWRLENKGMFSTKSL
jgi:hypothetical protein